MRKATTQIKNQPPYLIEILFDHSVYISNSRLYINLICHSINKLNRPNGKYLNKFLQTIQLQKHRLHIKMFNALFLNNRLNVSTTISNSHLQNIIENNILQFIKTMSATFTKKKRKNSCKQRSRYYCTEST